MRHASISTEPFYALRDALRIGRFPEYGIRLNEVLSGTWTTSSELISELGAVLMTIRKECWPLEPEEKVLLKRSLQEVRKAFPGFGIFPIFR